MQRNKEILQSTVNYLKYTVENRYILYSKKYREKDLKLLSLNIEYLYSKDKSFGLANSFLDLMLSREAIYIRKRENLVGSKKYEW